MNKEDFNYVTGLVAREPQGGDSTLAKTDKAFFEDPKKPDTVRREEIIGPLQKSLETLREKLDNVSLSLDLDPQKLEEDLARMNELSVLVSNTSRKLEEALKLVKTDAEILADIANKTGMDIYPN